MTWMWSLTQQTWSGYILKSLTDCSHFQWKNKHIIHIMLKDKIFQRTMIADTPVWG